MASLSQAQLLEYVVSKGAGAQATFKVNKLQQLLAALVKQSFVLITLQLSQSSVP